jgi:6-phosphogluconolactonase
MATETKRTLLFVGTYTTPVPHAKRASAKGIYRLNLDLSSGKLTLIGETTGIVNPSFVTINSRKRHLYATSEANEGMIFAYAIDPGSGELTFINSQPSLGSGAAYVSVDPTDRFVLAANYSSGKAIVIFPVRADGGIDPASGSAEHEGTGPNTARQERPHGHCVITDHPGKYVFVVDLGIDKVMIYKLDAANKQLIPNEVPSVSFEPGAGPRHLVFHPNGKNAYVIHELNSTISALAYDGTRGALEVLQTVSALPEGFGGSSDCADIQVTPSGKFLYGSNRGDDSIVIHAIDPNSGKMTYVGHKPTGGKIPRNFAIDPTGTFLLVGNQDSDTIVTFRINQQTGQLEDTGNVLEIPAPVCLKFMQI